MLTLELSLMGPLDPGTVGTPASLITSMAETLSPIRRMVSGDGPMKVKPLRSTCSAKSEFSDKNPYPGWTASELVTSMALMIAGAFR